MHPWWVLPAGTLFAAAIATWVLAVRVAREVRELGQLLQTVSEASARRRELTLETERARRLARVVTASLEDIAPR
ncbi:MAG: hypothetical protein WHS89_08060 [Acidimicrobiales bacterium]|jgi:hypothetical protein